MINTFQNFFNFLRNPKLEKDINKGIIHRLKVVTLLLTFSFFVVFFLLMTIGILTITGFIEENKHVLDDFFEKNNILEVFFFATILAPIIEEFIFRGPLVFFKKPIVLKFAFYGFALLFGYIHIFNFELTSNTILFSPILVAPQVYLGLLLGYIRIRFGLIWSILMHTIYNGILVSISILAIYGLK